MAILLVPSLMRELSDGHDRISVRGATLRQVINDLGQRYPLLKQRLLDDDRIRAGISIAIDGNVISAGLVEPVSDDAEIAIVPAISGGARGARMAVTPRWTPMGRAAGV